MAKFYAVRKGLVPGIYKTWPETQQQINGFSGAEFKSFTIEEQAIEYMNNVTEDVVAPADALSAYVDGSHSSETNQYSFGAVMLLNDKVLDTISRVGDNPKYIDSHQIAGEVFGALHAIQWAVQKGYESIFVHYDFIGIEKWANGEWDTKKPVSMDYINYYHKIAKHIDVYFIKVKAHAGNYYNELADDIAKEALEAHEEVQK